MPSSIYTILPKSASAVLSNPTIRMLLLSIIALFSLFCGKINHFLPYFSVPKFFINVSSFSFDKAKLQKDNVCDFRNTIISLFLLNFAREIIKTTVGSRSKKNRTAVIYIQVDKSEDAGLSPAANAKEWHARLPLAPFFEQNKGDES